LIDDFFPHSSTRRLAPSDRGGTIAAALELSAHLHSGVIGMEVPHAV
jgi:hypothetical protein